MNILIVLTPQFDPYTGGVQMSTYKMNKYFHSVGLNTAVFSFQVKGHIETDFTQVYNAESSGGQNNPKNTDRLKSVIHEFRPDVVINQMPYEHRIGKVLAQEQAKHGYLLLGCLRNTLYSVKLNLDKYRKSVLPKPLQPFFKNSFGKSLLLQKHKQRHTADLKKILDTYDKFVMFGPPNKEELKYFVGNYKTEKTAFIPNSIPAVLDKVPEKEKRILWLSRLSYGQKRADLILPFWKKVMHELPDWHFDVVGNGDAFDDLKREIEKDKIPRITLHGKQKPDEYYRKASIYIMTSAFEGFPNTLIEAQSFGCIPVVYQNYPIVNWVIEDQKNGFLISPFKVDEMAKATVKIASQKEHLNALHEASLNNARRFVIDEVGKKWLELFKREGVF